MGKDIVKYLASWDYDSPDQSELLRNLQTHGIDKKGFEYFRRLQSPLQLFIKDHIVEKCYEHYLDMNENPTSKLIKENFKLPLTDWEEHSVFFLQKSKRGLHKIGGKKPNSIILPQDKNMKTPFQYIGTIDCSDPLFHWIGLEFLHIVFPLYECNLGIYLDYSNPNAPIILDPRTFTDDWYDPEYKNLENVEFRETGYSSEIDIDPDDCEDLYESHKILFCGVPLWVQSPEVPVCPKSNIMMRFVCQLESDERIKLIKPRSIGAYAFADKSLCFGDCGSLYVFFQPETKILHVGMQL